MCTKTKIKYTSINKYKNKYQIFTNKCVQKQKLNIHK